MNLIDTKRVSQLPPIALLAIIFSPFFMAVFYYHFAQIINSEVMRFVDYLSYSYVMALSIVGAYQLFFWVQRNNHHYQSRCLVIKLDSYIPFIPQLVWFYSVGYYAFMGLMVININNLQQGIAIIFSGAVQLFIQCLCFYFMPIKTPSHYRHYHKKTLSRQFLSLVQRLDNGRCCFPSLHCSAMMFVSLFLYPKLGECSYLIVVSISLSCLLVKQHQIVDLLPSIPLAWCIYHFVYLNLI